MIVKSGAATFYEGDDPTCTPHVLPAGSSLFEPGGDVHVVRNEGSVPLVNVVIQLLPTGSPRLISEPSPVIAQTLTENEKGPEFIRGLGPAENPGPPPDRRVRRHLMPAGKAVIKEQPHTQRKLKKRKKS